MVKKRNLTQEKILQATRQLAEEIGMSAITFPKLAESLDIKYPSLYNHFKNMTELKLILSETLLEELKQQLLGALVGKSGGEAVKIYCQTYLDFAFKNEAVYELLINVPHSHSPKLIEKFVELNQIVQQILRFYPLSEEMLVHKSRELRSLLHGFISLRFLGYFQRMDVEAPLSYEKMVEDYISLLEITTSNKK